MGRVPGVDVPRMRARSVSTPRWNRSAIRSRTCRKRNATRTRSRPTRARTRPRSGKSGARRPGSSISSTRIFPIELDTADPWLDLTSFWPCPRPAFGTVVPKKLKPVPDIRQYKDQLEEINEYTARIAALSQARSHEGASTRPGQGRFPRRSNGRSSRSTTTPSWCRSRLRSLLVRAA